MKFKQIEHTTISYPSGRTLTVTRNKGVITVNSDVYNDNFNTNK